MLIYRYNLIDRKCGNQGTRRALFRKQGLLRKQAHGSKLDFCGCVQSPTSLDEEFITEL